MLSVEVRFPANRFHATPWNHHVNEGVVEWPPSPWRLLRAMVATRHIKAADEVNEEQLVRIAETLATAPPHYKLPRGTAAHTRHYMPLYQPGKTTKVFDTFIHVAENDPLIVTWEGAELSGEDRAALATLLARMGYLGRAESWAEARLRDEAEPFIEPNTYPVHADDSLAASHELVQSLAPLTPGELASWRALTFEQELDRILAGKREKAVNTGKDPHKARLTGADRKKLSEALPANLLDALHADTGDLQKQGWSGVPGTRWLDYARPRDLLTTSPARRPRRTVATPPSVARFAIASHAPPRLTEVVSVAERVRRALVSRSDALPVFSGKDAEGKPLQGHRHAFILPEANGSHGHVTHVSLFAPMGFDEDARRAMDGLRKAWGRGGHELQLVLLGVGAPIDFAGHDLRAGQCPLFLESNAWISRTPFVATRHAKANRRGEPKLDKGGLQIGSPEHDLRRLLRGQGYPKPLKVQALPASKLGGKTTRWLEFETRRSNGDGSRGVKAGTGFRVTFGEPVRGPVALGYGAHFGLGLFVPEGVLA